MSYILIFLIIIIVLILICFVIGKTFFDLALNPKKDKEKVFSAEHNKIDNVEENQELINDIEFWKNKITVTEKFIYSFDNLKLSAKEIINENKTNKWVVLCHGYMGNNESMFKYGYHFYKEGYNLLMPDLRGHGNSEGTYVGMGWHDRLDIKKWIEKIVLSENDSKIVLYGVSMGASTVLMTAGEKLPPNVTAVIEDCGYSSIYKEFKYQLKMIYHLPSFIILDIASIYTKIKAGYSLRDGNVIKCLKNAKLPILFIHGTKDTYVPVINQEILYNSYNGVKDIFTVEGAGHSSSRKIAKEKYWEKIFEFLNNI